MRTRLHPVVGATWKRNDFLAPLYPGDAGYKDAMKVAISEFRRYEQEHTARALLSLLPFQRRVES